MKIKTLLVALLGSLFLASCFEDDSSLNYKLMNPIVIDLGDEPTTYKVRHLGDKADYLQRRRAGRRSLVQMDPGRQYHYS